VASGSPDTNIARGGGLQSQAGALTITGCTVTGNQVLGGTSSYGIGAGGGIYVQAGGVTISKQHDQAATWPREPTAALRLA